MTILMPHEQLLIESYALGYLAHKLDNSSPLELVNHEAIPLHDNCFLHLMRRNTVMAPTTRAAIKGKLAELKKYIESYKTGYRDSQMKKTSKVRISKKLDIPKAWNRPKNIKTIC